MKYRKKPVEIEAIQWNGRNLIDMNNFITVNFSINPYSQTIEIPTLEGDMKASVGDYIIKGVQGEFYPCKPDIFKATYEKIL